MRRYLRAWYSCRMGVHDCTSACDACMEHTTEECDCAFAQRDMAVRPEIDHCWKRWTMAAWAALVPASYGSLVVCRSFEWLCAGGRAAVVTNRSER
jgi:hypothetical protein